MNPSLPDPVDRLSPAERRRWRRSTQRGIVVHEAEQLEALRGLARAETLVGWAAAARAEGLLAGPVDLAVGDRGLVARRMWVPAWASLVAAVSDSMVRLVAAGRYGPSWTLTFESPRERLVVLTDRIRLLPREEFERFRLRPAPAPLAAV